MVKIADIRWPTILCFMILSSCINVPQSARDSANLLAAYTNKVNTETQRYLKFRDDLAKARKNNMQILERDTLSLEQETSNYVGAWNIAGDKNRVKLYEGIISASNEVTRQQKAANELSQKQEQDLKETRTLLNVRSDKLREASKALSTLGEKLDYREDIKFLTNFITEVKESIEQASSDVKIQSVQGKIEAIQPTPKEEKPLPKP